MRTILCGYQIIGRIMSCSTLPTAKGSRGGGKYILNRPDPQIIWKNKRTAAEWKRADGIYRRSKSGGGEWTVRNMPENWTVSYGDLNFMLRPMGFKHTGLFPEQAVNWDWFSEIIRSAVSKNPEKCPRVLNMFAYTGGATAAAAAAGAVCMPCRCFTRNGKCRKGKPSPFRTRRRAREIYR